MQLKGLINKSEKAESKSNI